MRALLAIALLLTLGADYPQHRRFLQRNLPAGSCTPPTGYDIDTAWSATETVASTFTQNAAVSPSCDVDATRIQFPAVPGGYSFYRSTLNVSPSCLGDNASHAAEIHVRGNSSSGSFGFCIINSGAYNCATCAFSAAWSLCQVTSVVDVGGTNTGRLVIGNTGVFASPTGPTAAVDVFVWGARCL